MEELTVLISNMGFPIAMCVYMTVSMKQAIDKMTSAINNNTTIIQTLVDRSDK